MRSALTRSTVSVQPREVLAAAILLCAASGAWLVSQSPRAVHASLVALRIVVDYCLSTS